MVSCSSFTGCPLMYQKANPWGTITETNCSNEFWYLCSQKMHPVQDWTFLLYVGLGFRAWPFPGYLASRFTSIESFRLPNLSKFILVASLKFLSNLNFSWKKKRFFKVESTFIEISISFFDHQPVSQCPHIMSKSLGPSKDRTVLQWPPWSELLRVLTWCPRRGFRGF